MTHEEKHNTHMMLPKDLWARSRDRAILEGLNLTEIVCELLEQWLASRNQPLPERQTDNE